MELFYSKNISEGGRQLDADESGHCVRVLRHRRGDTIHVVDGHGMLYRCTIVDDDPRGVVFDVDEWVENYGSHDYWLRMAVCPPKNIDRFEWFAEKATEIGVDVINLKQGLPFALRQRGPAADQPGILFNYSIAASADETRHEHNDKQNRQALHLFVTTSVTISGLIIVAFKS